MMMMRKRFCGHVTSNFKMMMMMMSTTTPSTDTPMRAMLIGAPGSGTLEEIPIFYVFATFLLYFSLSLSLVYESIGS